MHQISYDQDHWADGCSSFKSKSRWKIQFRSSKHIYASVLTEQNDKTLCSYSSVKISKTEGQKKLDIAKLVGEKIAEMAIEKGVKEVKFDKGPYKYHGRLKVLADAAREKGLSF